MLIRPGMKMLLTSAVCLCATALTDPATAQAFTTIINVPPDPDPSSIGSDTQLNLLNGGKIGFLFDIIPIGFDAGASDGSSTNVEVNITGGTASDFFEAFSGSIINISGGDVGNAFTAHDGSVVNITGGNMGNGFEARSGSTIDISSGNVGNEFIARSGSQIGISGGVVGNDFLADNSSIVNISGGDVGTRFTADTDSVVNITGGHVGIQFLAWSGSTVNISGGQVGKYFHSNSGSTVNISGGEFFVGGVPVPGLDVLGASAGVNIPPDSRLTVTLADGTVNNFRPWQIGGIANGTLNLIRASLPTKPSIVNIPTDPAPQGLRTGQTLNLSDGGELGDDFVAIGSTVNVNGGSVGSGFTAEAGSTVNIAAGHLGVGFRAESGSTVNITGGMVDFAFSARPGSTVNISGGELGFGFEAHTDSTTNISGGTLGKRFTTWSGSTVNISGGVMGREFAANEGTTVNLIGSSFILDGVDLTLELTPGELMTLTDRDVILEGILVDGSPFSFTLNSTFVSSSDRFDPGATLTVTLVPEPNTLGLVGMGALCVLRRRRLS